MIEVVLVFFLQSHIFAVRNPFEAERFLNQRKDDRKNNEGID